MCRVHHGKCWAGWVTSWNQDCREKYSQPHISRWYHSNGRKWRRTKEPLDECERGEWKNWLNTQHLKKKTQGHGIWSHHFMTKRRGKNGSSGKFSSSWALKSLADDDCSLEIRRSLLLGRKVMTNLDSILKSSDITLLTKVLSSQSYGFSSSHVGMRELDNKESWALKNWCFWTVVL